MPVARVVRRQVAQEVHPPCVRGGDERAERLVAAEQRVDPVEARRVVAVRAAGGEDRRQVERARAERLDVVEVLLDPAQVAAEPLARRVRPAPGRQLVPLARDRPVRALLRAARCPREPVGEDLVDDGREVPRRPVAEREDEVVRVRHLVAVHADPVQPAPAALGADEQPAVRNARVPTGKRRAPPRLRLRLAVDLRRAPSAARRRRRSAGRRRRPRPSARGRARPRRRRARPAARGRSRASRRGAAARAATCRGRARSSSSLDRAAGEPGDDELLEEEEDEDDRRAASTTPAANAPQCSEYCWSMKLRSPSASVN